MALLIGLATHREIQILSDAGWKPGVLSPEEFRRCFLKDPGLVKPGLKIAFVPLNYTVNQVLNALCDEQPSEPRLRISDAIPIHADPESPREGA